MKNKIYVTSPILDVQLDIHLIHLEISFKYSTIKREFPILLNTNVHITAQTNQEFDHVLHSLVFSSYLGIPLGNPVVSTSKYITNWIINYLNFLHGPKQWPPALFLHFYSGLQ